MVSNPLTFVFHQPLSHRGEEGSLTSKMLPPILLSIGIFAQIFESSCGVSIGKSEIQEDIAFSCSKIVFKARFYLALVSK